MISKPERTSSTVGGLAVLCIAGAWASPSPPSAISPANASSTDRVLPADRVLPVAMTTVLPHGAPTSTERAGSGATGAGGDGAGGAPGPDGAGSDAGGVVSSPCADGACGHGPSASGAGSTAQSQGSAASQGGGSQAGVTVPDSVGDSGGFLGWLKNLFGGSPAAPSAPGSATRGPAGDFASALKGKDGGDVPADLAPQDGPLAQHAADAALGSASKNGRPARDGDTGFGGNVGSGAELPDGGVGDMVSSIVSDVSSMIASLMP